MPSQKAKTPRSQIAILGYSGVGKTALTHTLSGGAFVPTNSTHGLNISSLKSGSEEDPEQTPGLLDFGGMPHKDVLKEIEKAEFSLAIVVVDPSCDTVQKDVEYWTELLDSRNDDPPCKSFLVASRVDRGGAILDVGELRELSTRYGFSGVFETSAKDASGIQELRSAVLDASRSQDDETEDSETTVELLVRTLAEQLCQLIATNPHVLEEIEWRDLERVIAASLKGIGFEVELTRGAKDGGKDIVLSCMVGREAQVFYVEIKHWRQGGRPGLRDVSDFVEVNAVDGTHGGLFVSSSGFANAVHSRLSEISKQRIRLGGKNKIVSLCQKFVKSIDGLWHAEKPLPEILFEETLQ